MPWPRPTRRALCCLCIASCESVGSSFAVHSVFAAAAKSSPSRAAADVVRGGAASSSSGHSMLGMASGGLYDNSGGGGRQGVPAVQAVAEEQRVAVPAAGGEEELGLAEELASTMPQAPPPPLPSIEEGEGSMRSDVGCCWCLVVCYVPPCCKRDGEFCCLMLPGIRSEASYATLLLMLNTERQVQRARLPLATSSIVSLHARCCPRSKTLFPITRAGYYCSVHDFPVSVVLKHRPLLLPQQAVRSATSNGNNDTPNRTTTCTCSSMCTAETFCCRRSSHAARTKSIHRQEPRTSSIHA